MTRHALWLAVCLAIIACGSSDTGPSDDGPPPPAFTGADCAASQTATAVQTGANRWTVDLYYTVSTQELVETSDGSVKYQNHHTCVNVRLTNVVGATSAEAIANARTAYESNTTNPGRFNG